jgi:hypothetical protein
LNALNVIHSILFNAHILFSLILGIWSLGMAIRNQSISGNFWGAVATVTVLAAAITLFGIVMAVSGLRIARMTVYFLYMAWLVVIMPGLFTLLRGRDDRSAAVAFAILSFFNAATSFSMWQRGLVGPWLASEA